MSSPKEFELPAPDFPKRIAGALSLRLGQVAATIQLLDDGNTLPFIARYRKEATGELDEEEIRSIVQLLEKLRALEAKRSAVLTGIHAQGKLTAELRDALLAADTVTAIDDDLYASYRPKRRTRAGIARERGLGGLADLILRQVRGPKSALELAAVFVDAAQEVPTAEDALAGARDIVAEVVSENAGVRRLVRTRALAWAGLRTSRVTSAQDPKGVFETYAEFECRVDRLKPYQTLAINRGEKEGVLKVHVTVPERDWRSAVAGTFAPDPRSPLADQLRLAIDDAAERLLLPTIERDLRRSLSEAAETHAIQIFAVNLRALLSTPPLADRTVLGIDPGLRTGCKLAVVDATGRVLTTGTIYPHAPRHDRRGAIETLRGLIDRHGVSLIAIGNGTASRESEQLVAELTRDEANAHYLLVNEAGASVYSASPLARAELPGLDVSLRGAVSIARRAQDPLAELVKIDPQSIGVGLYQHDVDQTALGTAVDGVVESVVNQVGVDVNTASPALLARVAGIGPKLAERMVAHRDQHGPFPNRKSLKAVQGLGPKAFEQAAGFLRIRGGDDPLDASAIHPESYAVAKGVLKRAGLKDGERLAPSDREPALDDLTARSALPDLAQALGTGVPTLADILEQLVRPGRDPRADLPPPILRSDVLAMEDLVIGMTLLGTVRNVVDFGAFVDIGVKQDGLIHQSQLPRGLRLKVSDVIEVEVLRVEADRGRIGLGWVGRGHG